MSHVQFCGLHYAACDVAKTPPDVNYIDNRAYCNEAPYFLKVPMKRKLSLSSDKATYFAVFGFLALFLRYFNLFDM